MNVFLPNTVRVEPGSSIRWLNESNVPHNVVGTYFRNSTAENVHIDSGFFGKDRNFRYEFDDEGIFEYRCTIHSEEGMKGLLIISNK
jgi:plastocyanin